MRGKDVNHLHYFHDDRITPAYAGKSWRNTAEFVSR